MHPTSHESSASLVDDDRITAYGMLLEANRRLERVFERSMREHHSMNGVTVEALLRLARSEGGRMSMSELGDQMVLTSGGVTRLVDRLAAEGLVERRPCDSDRRVHWAQLTPEGRARLESVLATHVSDLEVHFASLISDDELPVLIGVLDRIRSQCEAPSPTLD